MKMKKVTSLLAMTVAAVMAMTGCGGNDAADDSAGNKVYHIGIIQQMEHGSLDQATKGFEDKLTELLGEDNVDIERGTCGMSVETLINLSRLYGVSLDTLIYGEKEKKSAASQEEQLMRGLNGMPQILQDYCLRMLWLFADGLRAAQAEAASECETVPETVKSSSDSKKNSGGEA